MYSVGVHNSMSGGSPRMTFFNWKIYLGQASVYREVFGGCASHLEQRLALLV
jgi:hypothetical protein